MSVLALAIAEEVLVSEYYLAFTGGLCLAPFNVGADIFRFALRNAAVNGDVKLGTGLIAVDALFLEVALSISETRDSTTSSLIRCCVVQSFPTGTLLYWEQVY